MNDELAWLTPQEQSGDFYEILVRVDRNLDDEEISRLSGCLGYALRAEMRGERLSDPEVVDWGTLHYWYDSTKSRSDDTWQAADRALTVAPDYIQNGTPVRKTNRGGVNTAGTRLVEGIGPAEISIWVR